MNIIKRKAISILEGYMGKSAQVLAVRAWKPATFFEVDLCLPEADMRKWDSVQHIKCKVADYTYRDYTPASWDAGTRTCTLYIETAHDGAGSKWAAALQEGDVVSYVGIESTSHKVLPGRQLVCLGDMSTIGNFLALRQLAGNSSPLQGAIAIADAGHRGQFYDYFRSFLTTVPQRDNGGYSSLAYWATQQDLRQAAVYIAGHIPTAARLRKLLKAQPAPPERIRVQGFWS